MQKLTILVLLFSNFIFAQRMEGVLFNGNIVPLETVLQRYIQIPSVSDNEKEAGDFFKAVCKENGLYITDFGSENGNYNFAASIFPLSENKPNIIFLNHIDVVPEKNTSEFDAYSGKIIDSEIYGRGAIDNKGVGYQVQVSQTYNPDNPVQIITAALPQTASESDQNAAVDDIALLAPTTGKDADRLGLEECELDCDNRIIKCPCGKSPLHKKFDGKTGRAVFSSKTCKNCPKFKKCIASKQGNNYIVIP